MLCNRTAVLFLAGYIRILLRRHFCQVSTCIHILDISLLPEAFAVVYSVKYASTRFLHLTKYGMKIIQSCKLSGFHQHDDSTLKHLFEESDNYQSVDIPLTVRDLRN